ncbi:MAG: transcription-repair coupling factor [Fimbriimonadales bacterium]|nr:transcription-repair coupling factor [Fimbriimonadales bacterium]
MRFSDWVASLLKSPALQPLFEGGPTRVEWAETCPASRPPLLAARWLANPTKVLVVAPSYEKALAWEAKLTLSGIPKTLVRQLPSGLSALFEDATPEYAALSDRMGALQALASDEPCVVVATPGAALERTLPRELIRESLRRIFPGLPMSPENLAQTLVKLGYEFQEPVRLPGQFSRRGGIVDVYAAGQELPIRIEFFGDEVETLRAFDPGTQRSVGPVEALDLMPARETIIPPETGGLGDLVRSALLREAASLPSEAASRLEELVSADAECLDAREYFDRLDLYRPLLLPDSGCAVDLLGPTGWLVLDEPLELQTVAERVESELSDALDARSRRGEILSAKPQDFLLPVEKLGSHEPLLALNLLSGLPPWVGSLEAVSVEAKSLEPYAGRSEALASNLRNWLDAGFSVAMATDQPNRAQTVLHRAELPASAPESPWDDAPPRGLWLVGGNPAGGFVLPTARTALLTDAELFGVARLRLPQRRFSEGAPIATVLDLKPGDYVVHIHFGIGVFRGLVKRNIDGIEKEFLYLEYAPPDKLFVPTDQLDRVQKYLNPGDAHPKLNRLTGGDWRKTIAKAKEDARQFARELVQLYAARSSVERPPIAGDTPWQQEMESTFPWVETPSQLRAIQEVKEDLARPYPMDRLVCGDVGFGKTEVAIRAAFRVVQEGRQVAVLCPTTILSEQHFRNFRERLESFGVRLELLNRFRTAKERKAVVDGLRAGEVDIVIGTHSLLTKEIAFRHLGLVVIDEEQKFGVRQKEALKKLRTQVDVLSLSATPIPRTLSMALMDIRQLSLINDPPPGRLPIRTFVRPYSNEVVREAILRELARGGQIFYVYNRVESIGHVAERLRRMVPDARIGVGHGQMSEDQLEPVMIGFIRGEIDILLSTTIIENGIDIPNANTLIVENADQLGMAQLYQLRGRVGRSDRQAYAYLLYQPSKALTEGSLARLEALQEFSSLGSGYSLAFRDLQIRGAGDLLGAKQHGSMAAVGYELYTQLINEAVLALKSAADGQPASPGEVADPLASLQPLPTLDVPVPALIPATYIADQAQRLYYYQQMMTARSLEQLASVAGEIEDRYGHPPQEVKNAFTVMACRFLADELGMEKIDAKGGRVAVTFRNRSAVPPMVFSLLARRQRASYVTREMLVWPYEGDPLVAVQSMLAAFQRAMEEYRAARAAART